MTSLKELIGKQWLLAVWLPVLSFVALSLLSLGLDSWYPILIAPALIAIYLVFFKTYQAYQLLLFLIPLSIPVTDVGGGLGMSLPAEPFIWLLFVGLVLHFFSGARVDADVIKHPITICVLLYMIWTLASTLVSSMPLVSVKYSLSTLWFLAVFMVLPVYLFQKKIAFIHTYFQWLLWGTVILVAYTLVKHAGGGFSRPYAHTAMRPFLPDHGVYAALLAMLIPYGAMAFVKGSFFGMGWLKRSMLGAAAFVLLLGVVFSFTRASWISLAVAALVTALLVFRVRLWMFVSALAIFLGLVLFFWADITNELSRNTQGSDDDFAKHLSSVYNISTDPSNLERLNRWDCALHMYDERPLLGWGPGTYTFQYAPFQKSYRLTLISTHAGDVGNVHSEFLRPLAESGLMGAIFFFAIALFAFSIAWKSYERSKNPEHRFLLLAIIAGFSTYLFHGLVNNYLDYDKIAAPYWGMIAAILVLNLKIKKEKA
jgi:O-antigen ligase